MKDARISSPSPGWTTTWHGGEALHLHPLMVWRSAGTVAATSCAPATTTRRPTTVARHHSQRCGLEPPGRQPTKRNARPSTAPSALPPTTRLPTATVTNGKIGLLDRAGAQSLVGLLPPPAHGATSSKKRQPRHISTLRRSTSTANNRRLERRIHPAAQRGPSTNRPEHGAFRRSPVEAMA